MIIVTVGLLLYGAYMAYWISRLTAAVVELVK